MATYVNDLRLKEIATGDEAGTWGTSTNTNLELIGEALGYGTQDCFSSDADATTTVADGATDPARAMYFKVTSSATLSAGRTLTIAPNTISRLMFIENATTGSQVITISQGTGGNVAIANGKTAVVYLDGAGSGAAVVDAMALVDPGINDTLAETLAAGNTTGGTNIELTTTDKVQFRDSAIYLNSSADGQLDIVADTEVQIAATTIDINGNVDISGTAGIGGVLTANAGVVVDNITIDGAEIDCSADMTLDVAGDLTFDVSGGDVRIKADGTQEMQFKITDGANVDIISTVADDDIRLRGNDGGATITALTLDMSEAGAATFNAGATFGSGIDVTGTITFDGGTTSADLNFGDNDKAVFGAGSDLSIFHDGSSSIIRDSGTGNLAIQAEDFAVQSADASATHIFAEASTGYVALNYGGSTKLNTSSTGINVTGAVTVDAGTNGQIDFGNVTTNYGRLYADSTGTFVGSVTADPLIFRTTNTERMRIDSSGRLGIGTTSPNQLLTLGSSTGTATIGLDFETTNVSRGSILYNAAAGEMAFTSGYSGYGGYMTFDCNGSERMRIDSNGRVSIGSSPSSATELLNLTATSGNGAGLEAAGNGNTLGSTSMFIGQGSGSDAYVWNRANSTILFGTNNTECARFGSSGDMEIGSQRVNQGAGRYLDIYNAGTDSVTFSILRLIRQQAASSTLTTSEFYARKNGETSLWNFDPNSAAYLRAGVGSTEGWRINSSGKVGIGDSNPDTGLTIGSSFLTNSVAGASVKVKAIASSSILEIGQDGNNSALLTLTNSSGTETIRAAGHNGALTITGALSKGSGSFKIDHPLPSKTDTHHLVHSFVEAPQADNIYRGKVDLIDGSASVNIDAIAGMTEGTFVLLNRDVQCFTSNESGWTAVKGTVSGNILTITAQDNTCTDAISWLVIGERQDQHMHDTDWTDSNGKVIVEPSKGD